MPKLIRHSVQMRRGVLRASGLRPIPIWVPDIRITGFAEECRRQSLVVAATDLADRDLDKFMDAAFVDLRADATGAMMICGWKRSFSFQQMHRQYQCLATPGLASKPNYCRAKGPTKA